MGEVSTNNKPIKIAVLAMGGQGGGVLCNWIVQTAESANYIAQSTSVPGVAQRTGATVYYIEVVARSNDTELKPMLALMPVPGHVDLVVAGELIESGRAILRGLVTPDRTTTIVSTHRDYAVGEKSAMGDGRVDSGKLFEATEKHSMNFIGFDMAKLAEENESVISSVLFGSIAGSGVLPFEKSVFESVITESGIAVESNLKGFEAGFVQAQERRNLDEQAPQAFIKANTKNKQIQNLLDRVEKNYPRECHEMLVNALRKLLDYQDVYYGKQYLDRMDKVLKLDKSDKHYRLTIETARYLALWMSYEDTIRIADLKTRSSRIKRVEKEVQAESNQIVRIKEYMHPRVEEICDTLPASLGSWCLKSEGIKKLLGMFCN
ncbi:MAG: indolepyruvate ferredoxin oxidoreductase beta subunit, partial [Gammaproteobacteria bacterium]